MKAFSSVKSNDKVSGLSRQMSLNATIARTRAMWGKRLTADNYRDLMNCDSVGAAAEYLKNKTYFAPELREIDTSAIHRENLEQLLRKSSYNRFMKLCHFQSLDSLPFFNFAYLDIELSELLRFLICFSSGNTDRFLQFFPGFLIGQKHHKNHVDFIELSRAETVEDILNTLKYTTYLEIISDSISADGQLDYPLCENRLRTLRLENMLSAIEEYFHGKAKQKLVESIQMQIDLINIINSYRLLHFLHLDRNEVKKHILPFYGRLTEKKLDALLDTDSEEAFIAQLEKSIYGKQLSEIKGSSCEIRLSALRANLARLSLMSAQGAAVCLYSVHYLFEIETNNVITIIEGIRYGKDFDYIDKFLVY